MSTLTERHAALNKAASLNPKSWTVASNGVGVRHWFVRSQTDSGKTAYHTDKQGALIRYTEIGAIAKAEALNKTVQAYQPF